MTVRGLAVEDGAAQSPLASTWATLEKETLNILRSAQSKRKNMFSNRRKAQKDKTRPQISTTVRENTTGTTARASGSSGGDGGGFTKGQKKELLLKAWPMLEKQGWTIRMVKGRLAFVTPGFSVDLCPEPEEDCFHEEDFIKLVKAREPQIYREALAELSASDDWGKAWGKEDPPKLTASIMAKGLEHWLARAKKVTERTLAALDTTEIEKLKSDGASKENLSPKRKRKKKKKEATSSHSSSSSTSSSVDKKRAVEEKKPYSKRPLTEKEKQIAEAGLMQDDEITQLAMNEKESEDFFCFHYIDNYLKQVEKWRVVKGNGLVSFYYCKPTCRRPPIDGRHKIDYFQSEAEVQQYVQENPSVRARYLRSYRTVLAAARIKERDKNLEQFLKKKKPRLNEPQADQKLDNSVGDDQTVQGESPNENGNDKTASSSSSISEAASGSGGNHGPGIFEPLSNMQTSKESAKQSVSSCTSAASDVIDLASDDESEADPKPKQHATEQRVKIPPQLGSGSVLEPKTDSDNQKQKQQSDAVDRPQQKVIAPPKPKEMQTEQTHPVPAQLAKRKTPVGSQGYQQRSMSSTTVNQQQIHQPQQPQEMQQQQHQQRKEQHSLFDVPTEIIVARKVFGSNNHWFWPNGDMREAFLSVLPILQNPLYMNRFGLFNHGRGFFYQHVVLLYVDDQGAITLGQIVAANGGIPIPITTESVETYSVIATLCQKLGSRPFYLYGLTNMTNVDSLSYRLSTAVGIAWFNLSMGLELAAGRQIQAALYEMPLGTAPNGFCVFYQGLMSSTRFIPSNALNILRGKTVLVPSGNKAIVYLCELLGASVQIEYVPALDFVLCDADDQTRSTLECVARILKDQPTTPILAYEYLYTCIMKRELIEIESSLFEQSAAAFEPVSASLAKEISEDETIPSPPPLKDSSAPRVSGPVLKEDMEYQWYGAIRRGDQRFYLGNFLFLRTPAFNKSNTACNFAKLISIKKKNGDPDSLITTLQIHVPRCENLSEYPLPLVPCKYEVTISDPSYIVSRTLVVPAQTKTSSLMHLCSQCPAHILYTLDKD